MAHLVILLPLHVAAPALCMEIKSKFIIGQLLLLQLGQLLAN